MQPALISASGAGLVHRPVVRPCFRIRKAFQIPASRRGALPVTDRTNLWQLHQHVQC